MSEYSRWFESVSGFAPHPWQAELGEAASLEDRLLRVPTGFGKTAGVVLAWLHNAVQRKDSTWPRRLVFTLPMRVLVEQTERAISEWLSKASAEQVGLHVLMGGCDAGEWALTPERPAILVGTQDMLLSRALNRGYAAPRARWPVDFGLLHQDALWVLDEIQLMDVGLATSGQLAAFRLADAASHRGTARPTATWWMSATLQPSWLGTVDVAARVPELTENMVAIPSAARSGGLWEVKKTLARRADVTTPSEIAEAALAGHNPGTLSLVVVNRVDTATGVFDELDKRLSEGKGKKRTRRADAPDLRLVHSRFRGAERVKWAESFLRRDAAVPDSGRIIVATQVVEAGVDISARLLVSELAPWPSLVQRFGRAARYAGEEGEVCVVGAVPNDEGKALPYSLVELGAAEEALSRLLGGEADVSPSNLEAFEEHLAESPEGVALIDRLYPYDPEHVVRRRDLDDLFDTAPDLSGNDLDVSRYIRSGDERDISVFWRPVEDGTRAINVRDLPAVRREELCPAPIGEARKWLTDRSFYVLDYLEGTWARAKAWQLHPGMRVLVPEGEGGYSLERGWDPKASARVQAPNSHSGTMDESAERYDRTASSEEDDSLSIAVWKSIAMHGREAAAEVQSLCEALALDPDWVRLLELAARWHDAGKAHDVFQAAIKEESRRDAGKHGTRRDLAKAPSDAWRRPAYPERKGFRHELVSTLALFELLRRAAPNHDALLGPHLELMEALGDVAPELAADQRVSVDHPLAAEIMALEAEEFDLLAYLVCAHHGKVRCAWTGTPHDQERGEGDIHGVRDGDSVAAFELCDVSGVRSALPPLRLSLAGAEMGLNQLYGASWTERVSRLRELHGPFKLAYLEALLRAADARASRLTTMEDE